MDRDFIYSILESKPHNKHYLKRYIKFIDHCSELDNSNSMTVGHHICPKAKSLFPEYRDFKKHPWNEVRLTEDQHFIAHWILAKAYGGGMLLALRWMIKKTKPEYGTVNNKTYRWMREELSKHLKGTKRSEETKQKIREARKHQKIIHSEETKQKIKETNKGVKPSKSTMDGLKKWHKTRKDKEHQRAVKIVIYDNNGIPRYKAEGDFRKVCAHNGLSFAVLRKTIEDNNKVQPSKYNPMTKKAATRNRIVGWYARKVQEFPPELIDD